MAEVITEDGTEVNACVIVNRGLSNYPPGDPESPANHLHGLYLAAYDPDADAPDAGPLGGRIEWTTDLDAAKVFDGFRAAHAEWTRQSTRVPLRPDGQPNKPMTAFHIEVVTMAAARLGEDA